MSDDTRIELRDLPPVAPVVWPERLSQTLARYLNRCPRAGYLYVASGGGAPTHEMDRGSLAHAGLERMMVDWIRFGEGGYGGRAPEELSSLTAELLAEVWREHPELWCSHEERDVARLCVFHAALGLDVNPEDVVGVERKFVLELDCGWPVSGKIDLASMPEDTLGQVDDYKTQLHVPPRDEWDRFQAKLYACLLVWGRPVERVPCGECHGSGTLDFGAGDVNPPGAPEVVEVECDACAGRGSVEEFGDSIGGHLQRVTGRELYPRHDPRKRADLKLARNEETWTRLELQEFVADLNATGERLSEMLTTWKFPARYGTKACGECPAESLCPIPRGYRRFAGHIRSVDEAAEAWAWARRMEELVKVTTAEVKEFSATNAVPIPVGDDEYVHQLTEARKLKTKNGRADWDGLAAAIEHAMNTGAEFDLSEWVKTSNTSAFKKVKKATVTKSEVQDVGPVRVERESREDAERRRDEQHGADAPY